MLNGKLTTIHRLSKLMPVKHNVWCDLDEEILPMRMNERTSSFFRKWLTEQMNASLAVNLRVPYWKKKSFHCRVGLILVWNNFLQEIKSFCIQQNEKMIRNDIYKWKTKTERKDPNAIINKSMKLKRYKICGLPFSFRFTELR